MGDPSKDHMDLDEHPDVVANHVSPRPSLQLVRESLTPTPSVQMQPQESLEEPFKALPPIPRPSILLQQPQQQMENYEESFKPQPRPSLVPPPESLDEIYRPPPRLSLLQQQDNLDEVYRPPSRPSLLQQQQENEDFYKPRPSLLQQQFLHSPSATPRLSTANFVPVKRDSGLFGSQAAINESEPYSPASAVSSSGEGVIGHIDRGKYAMLARAYQDKQQSQVKAWERHKNTKNLNKYESEIARITAWEACQCAKAEALMKKSEEELEKKRAKLREGFKNEIASIHRRADEWKALAETRRVEELLRTEEGAARFRATGMLPKKPLLHIQSLRDMCCGFNLPYKRTVLAVGSSSWKLKRVLADHSLLRSRIFN